MSVKTISLRIEGILRARRPDAAKADDSRWR
jgi:hypothetical protein